MQVLMATSSSTDLSPECLVVILKCLKNSYKQKLFKIVKAVPLIL